MNSIENNFKKENCCGCTACFNVCPCGAISMTKDEKGFLYPIINHSLCVNCGACLSVCDFRNDNNQGDLLRSMACKHNNLTERRSSTSGGAFQILVDFILSKHGVVFGCELKDSKTIVHSFYDVPDKIDNFKKSKYVQSNLGDTFSQCLELLKQGRYVLFSGTGCQIAGLLSFLNYKKACLDNLLTCDIVCHGCPSPDVWSEFVDEMEKREGAKVVDVSFRNKEFGWHSHVETITFDNGKIINSNKWASMFYSNNLFRESCYNCKYTTTYRKSDFTIADCWGIERNNKAFDDNEGVSLVMFHTKKSLSLLQCFNNSSECLDLDIENYVQPQMIHPVQKGKHYNRFWGVYCKNKKKAVKKYFFRSKIRLFLQGIKDKLLKVVRDKNGSHI